MTKAIPRNYYDYENWRFWNSIGAAMLVYSISNLGLIRSYLGWRFMQFLGKISFPLYLVHMPFIWTAGDRICRLLGVARQDFTTWYDSKLQIPDVGPPGISTGFLVSQVIIFPLNILLALCAWKLLDKPGIAIGRWIVTRIGLGKQIVTKDESCVGSNHRAAAVYMVLEDLEQQGR